MSAATSVDGRGGSVPEALRRLGWTQAELPEPPQPGWQLGRVVAVHRGHVDVAGADGEAALTLDPLVDWAAVRPEQRPAVGDWGWMRGSDGRLQHWAALLDRRTALVRAAAGEHFERQVIAANIDSVFVVVALDARLSVARIQRTLLLAEASGAAPVLVLTKADRLDAVALEACLQRLAEDLRHDLPRLALDARDRAQVAALGPWLAAGQTVAMVGLSGAGKSTLANSLLGEARQATGAVRDYDQRGRHTTTTRRLLQLPGGACLIDTPGIRELKLSGDESLAAFEDVRELAAGCRFADCAHAEEPGCAVRAALAAGQLDPGRLEQYLKLASELEQARRLKRIRRGAPPRRPARPAPRRPAAGWLDDDA